MKSAGISSQVVIGLLVVLVGVLLLLDTTNVADVGNVVRWTPSLLILYGLWRLAAGGFKRVTGPAVIIIVGALVQLLVLGVDGAIVWPSVLIAVGLVLVLSRLAGRRSGRRAPRSPDNGPDAVSHSAMDNDDAFNVMGSVKRTEPPGDYSGGQVTAIMGGTELDLRDAVVTEKPATLEVTAVMAEVKLRVPPDWSVWLDNTTMMGESKDERNRGESHDGTPDLVIVGTVVMGSLKIDD